MNIIFRRNLGFIYDLCQVITCKMARRENWIAAFIKIGNESADLKDLESILDRFETMDPALLLFGFREKKKGSLIEGIFENYANQYAKECDLDGFVEYLQDGEQMRNMVMDYYLGDSEEEDVLKAIADKQELSADIKALLYEFFLFTERYMKKVADAINQVAVVLKEVHSKNLDKTLECQESFSLSFLEKENSPFTKKKRWERGIKSLYVAFSLVRKYAGLRNKPNDSGWMILGYDYRNAMNETVEPKIDIAAFGNAFGDKIRVMIVEALVKNGEMSLADLSRYLNVVNTVAIYHLDILKKENLLLQRPKGHRVLYCLNLKQIEKDLEAVKNLCIGNNPMTSDR